MPKENDYKSWKDHDILVVVATKQDSMHDDIKELKAEDKAIHHRINQAHSRINKLKFWSASAGGIGGTIGAFLAWFSSK